MALLLALLLLPISAHGGGAVPAHPEHRLGPLVLGMDEAAFQRLTGIAPTPCPVCLPEERLATLEGPALARLLPEIAPAGPMDLFFYRGRLYQITLALDQPLAPLVRHLSDRFLAPPEAIDLSPELAQLRWQDDQVRISLNYDPRERRPIALNYHHLPTLAAREAALAEATPLTP